MSGVSPQPAVLSSSATGVTSETLAVIQPLTEAERLDARDRARRNIRRKIGAQPTREQFNSAGPRPSRERFADTTISEYPAWVTRAIGGMLIIAFAGAFATSAFSVFSAGRDHFLEAMPGGAGTGWQAVIVGLAVVLLAEFLTIASVLGSRILLSGKRVWQAVMLLPIAAGVVMAVTANAVISKPDGFWPWLVTVTPPVSVVFLSLILEQIALTDIKRRHSNERAFQLALREWQAATRQDDATFAGAMQAWEARINRPEEAPFWRQTYANALREALQEANSKGRGRAERLDLMGQLGGAEWAALVLREMRADQWFEVLAVDSQPAVEAPQLAVEAPAVVAAQSASVPAMPGVPQLTLRPDQAAPASNGHNGAQGSANGGGETVVNFTQAGFAPRPSNGQSAPVLSSQLATRRTTTSNGNGSH